MGFYSIADEPPIELHPEHTAFYQERVCSFSIFELISQDRERYNVEFLNEPSGNIECFGKNSWFEYQPPKLIENGIAVFINDHYSKRNIKGKQRAWLNFPTRLADSIQIIKKLVNWTHV